MNAGVHYLVAGMPYALNFRKALIGGTLRA